MTPLTLCPKYILVTIFGKTCRPKLAVLFWSRPDMAAIQCGDPGKVRENAPLFSQNKVNMAVFGNRACKQTDPAEG